MISSFERIKSQLNSAVMMARRIHLFPFRTQKLSFVTPRVVRGTPLARVGNCYIDLRSRYAPFFNQGVDGSSPPAGVFFYNGELSERPKEHDWKSCKRV